MQAKYKEKVDILRLNDVIQGEKTGGYGRSIEACKKLAKGWAARDETEAIAGDLRNHLHLVQCARNLQSENVASRTDSELLEALDKMEKAHVKIPLATHVALVHRRSKSLRNDAKTGEKAKLLEYLACCSPWIVPTAPVAKSLLDRYLYECEGVKDKHAASFFLSEPVVKCITHIIESGDEKVLSVLAECLGQVVANIDAINLGAGCAGLLTELIDIHQVLLGLCTPVSSSRMYSGLLKKFEDLFGRTGTSATQRVVNAIEKSSWAKHVHACGLAADVLRQIMPAVEKCVSSFPEWPTMSTDERAKTCKEAAGAIIQHQEVAPAGHLGVLSLVVVHVVASKCFPRCGSCVVIV